MYKHSLDSITSPLIFSQQIVSKITSVIVICFRNSSLIHKAIPPPCLDLESDLGINLHVNPGTSKSNSFSIQHSDKNITSYVHIKFKKAGSLSFFSSPPLMFQLSNLNLNSLSVHVGPWPSCLS